MGSNPTQEGLAMGRSSIQGVPEECVNAFIVSELNSDPEQVSWIKKQ
jgi:hypothetical protein